MAYIDSDQADETIPTENDSPDNEHAERDTSAPDLSSMRKAVTRSPQRKADAFRKIFKRPATQGANSIGGAAAGGVGAEAAAVGATAAPTMGPILIGIGIVIFILLLLFIVFIGNQGFGGNGDNSVEERNLPKVSIRKTGPQVVPNPDFTQPDINNLQYTIEVSYPGYAEDLIITDPIPTGAAYQDSNPKGKLLDANGIETTENNKVEKVEWSLRSIQGGGTNFPTAAQTINISAYSDPPYSLPFPDPNTSSGISFTEQQMNNFNKIGTIVRTFQEYILSQSKNNGKYTDPFASVIWSGAVLNNGGDPYWWYCPTNNGTINNGCKNGLTSSDWRVGYGASVREAIPLLNEIFVAVYGATSGITPDTVKDIGQTVINRSGGKIINPTDFPLIDVQSLIDTASGTGDDAEKAQQALSILLMDPKINAVATAIQVATDISEQDNWSQTIQQKYHKSTDEMKQIANRMLAISQKYTGISAGSFSDQLLTITLRSLTNDAYIINKAQARVIGGRGLGGPAGPTPVSLDPNDNNCGGYYAYWINVNPLKKNFGDPECTMLANKPEDLNKLKAYIQQLAPDDYIDWFDTVIKRESRYIPNAYNGGALDQAGAWGLVQMGRGKNGIYDHGDVDWQSQMSNAINYNKYLDSIGLKWCYWTTCDFHPECLSDAGRRSCAANQL